MILAVDATFGANSLVPEVAQASFAAALHCVSHKRGEQHIRFALDAAEDTGLESDSKEKFQNRGSFANAPG